MYNVSEIMENELAAANLAAATAAAATAAAAYELTDSAHDPQSVQEGGKGVADMLLKSIIEASLKAIVCVPNWSHFSAPCFSFALAALSSNEPFIGVNGVKEEVAASAPKPAKGEMMKVGRQEYGELVANRKVQMEIIRELRRVNQEIANELRMRQYLGSVKLLDK